MSREVRMVPADWEHPVPAEGPATYRGGGKRYVPLHKQSYRQALEEYEQGALKWEQGLVRSYSLSQEPDQQWEPKATYFSEYKDYADYAGQPPKPEEYMPDWPPEQRTHWMMYESVSEGTPISPAFATPEELARWLADTNASSFADRGATYEQWLATCRSGWAISAVSQGGKLVSGVEATPDG
jgi:hypothetical protein